MSNEFLDKIRADMLARNKAKNILINQAKIKAIEAREQASYRQRGQTLGTVIEDIRNQLPLHQRWAMKGPGDIDPISPDEAIRCSLRPLQFAIQKRLAERSAADAEAARQAWTGIAAPNRTKGVLSRPIPVRWHDTGGIQDPPEDDDIPF